MRLASLVPFAALMALVAGACAPSLRLPAAIPPAAGTPRVLYTLRTLEVAEGRGAAVEPAKCLYLHYTGWLTDGRQFDSSHDTLPDGQPREPISFSYGARQVRPGWDAGGLDGMKVGGKRRLFIPSQLGYGAPGRPPYIPPFADLIFDLELMAVADTLPRTPADLGPQCPSWRSVSGGR
jgi:peptidylprolyl isomerase